jgi:outer membrane protein assembly factor BamB
MESVRAGEDWPTFLGPTGDGRSAETDVWLDWPPDGPPVLWHRRLGAGYGIGSVYGARFFQFDRVDDQARLTCLDVNTGDHVWQFQYPTDYEDLYGYNGGPRCSPVVDGGRVYVYGAEGMLHCVSAADGRPLWHVDTVRRFGVVQNFFGVGSTPVVAGRLLLLMVGGSPPEDRGIYPGRLDQVRPNGSCIVALDKLSGEVVYQTGDDLASYATLKLATIGGRRWCFAFARNGLLAFDPTTGAVDFHYPWRAKKLESVNASTPVVVDDQVFISETYGPGSSLLRVRPGGYDVVWQDELRSRERALETHWNTPIHHAGYLYGCSGRHTYNADLRCIQWQTGKVMWKVPELTRTSLLYVDGHFICLGEYGQLFVFRANPAEFQPVAKLREGSLCDAEGAPLLQYPCWAAPILSHGLLFVRGKDRLVCLDLRGQQPASAGDGP